MMPGPDNVIKCPHCKAVARVFTLSSANTLGGLVWTDGKEFYPMFPSPPDITRCGSCLTFYWASDVRAIAESWHGSQSPEQLRWQKAPHIVYLSEAELYLALESEASKKPEQEKELRFLAFRASNDGVRKPPVPAADTAPGTKVSPETVNANIEKLVKMLGTSPEDTLFKAEILREQGRFDEALAVLDKTQWGELDEAAS